MNSVSQEGDISLITRTFRAGPFVTPLKHISALLTARSFIIVPFCPNAVRLWINTEKDRELSRN